MDLALNGKVALVGGASQGIGYAIARLLAAEGARWRWWRARRSRSTPRRAQIAAETGSETLPIAADIRRADDCARIVEAALGPVRTHRRARQQRRCAAARHARLVRRRRVVARGRAEPDERRAARARRAARHARAALGAHRQHRGAVGAAADSAVRPVGRDVGRRDRLRQDAVARGGGRRRHGAHDLPGPHRDAAARHGVRRGRRRARSTTTTLAEMARQIPMQRHRHRPTRSPAWWRFLASPWSAYMTGCVFHVDGGRRAGVL